MLPDCYIYSKGFLFRGPVSQGVAMNRGIICITVAAGVLLSFATLSHAQEETTTSAIIYATYFECNPADEARADEIVKRNYAPHYDAAVEAGEIASWSWLSHFVGGKWRRVLIITATNMDDLLDASGALGEILAESTPEAGRVFTEVCDVHEDYIWTNVEGVGSAALGEERGAAGFSMYFECDQSREAKADELVQEFFGPIYDQQMADGGLISWAWLQHNVGGDWRRLLTTTSSDHKTAMHTRAKIVTALGERRVVRAQREFNEICSRHHDYMWDIQLETP